MVQYIIPLASLLLTFLSTMACLRFLFSRQGLFWIIPLAVSALLTMDNAFIIFAPQLSFTVNLPFMRFFPLVLSFFWYMMVITFHYALKRKITKNRYINDMKKNWTEAKFLEKNERRNFRRHSKRKRQNAINSYYQPEVKPFDKYNLDLFD